MTSTSLHHKISEYIHGEIMCSCKPRFDVTKPVIDRAYYHSEMILTLITKHFCDSEHIHTSEEILKELKDNS